MAPPFETFALRGAVAATVVGVVEEREADDGGGGRFRVATLANGP